MNLHLKKKNTLKTGFVVQGHIYSISNIYLIELHIYL